MGGEFTGRTIMTLAARAGMTLAARAGAAANRPIDASATRAGRPTRDARLRAAQERLRRSRIGSRGETLQIFRRDRPCLRSPLQFAGQGHLAPQRLRGVRAIWRS